MRKSRFHAFIILLVLVLSGCSFSSGESKAPVIFYYPRKTITYGAEDSVIASEIREASGHTNDLQYLLTIYFHGPMNNELVSPFPGETALISFQMKDDTLILELSDTFSVLQDLERTIACVCLAKTCFHMTDAENITILSGPSSSSASVKLTFTRDNCLLADSVPQAENLPSNK